MLQNPNWTVEEAPARRGVVAHHAAPRFQAFWTTGREELATIDGPCWTQEGSGDEDALHIFGFAWTDAAPSQSAFESLMRQAAAAIEDWITDRL